MITKVQKWGNSQGLRLSKELLNNINIEVGDEVEVVIQDGKLVISPRNKFRVKHQLSDLVRLIPKDYQPAELDWGEPSGKEAW